MEKILTIIVPVYNTSKYLVRCFNSLNNPLVSVIIINDGSTDNSLDVINEYISKNSNFNVITTENRGAHKARLTGLQQVNTEFFAFVDSDDVIDIRAYLSLIAKMQAKKIKVGNGRTTVYLPEINIPFHSMKWQKDILDFSKDKREFSNTICSLVGKIFHSDCIPLFMEDSMQTVYEDMEFVYYVLAKENQMVHTNDLIYNYCMRGLKNNSTSAIGLNVLNSYGLKGILGASTSMIEKFKRDGLYDFYRAELNSIIIKLIYQRIFNILTNNNIKNRKEMAALVLNILDAYLPNWRDNPYFKEGFKGSEYNDFLFFIFANIIINICNIKSLDLNDSYEELLDSYNRRLVL